MTDTPLNQTTTTTGWLAAPHTPLVLGLAGLLAMQLLLAAVTSGGNRLAPAATDDLLANFEAEHIDRIEIITPEGTEPLLLSRADSGWIMPGLGDFPADATRIDQLLQTLAELHRPLPIATSESARQRFKVADAVFEQRITLTDGKATVATLILGDAPGFRRRYLRLAGDDAIHDVRFEVFNLSDQPADWIARDQLRLERDRIQRLTADNWRLSKQGDTWILDGAASNDERELDQTKVQALLTTLANLSYREVLGTQAPQGFDPDAPMLALEIGLDEKDSRRYLIAEHAKDQDSTSQNFVLKTDNRAHYFLLSEFDLGPLKGLDANKLVKSSEPAAAGVDAED